MSAKRFEARQKQAEKRIELLMVALQKSETPIPVEAEEDVQQAHGID